MHATVFVESILQVLAVVFISTQEPQVMGLARRELLGSTNVKLV
jgi:hypothetical protein